MSEQLDLMIKHLREENEQLCQQRMAAIRSTAQQLEHEDTAPHEGCGCKLCEALIKNEQLRAELIRGNEPRQEWRSRMGLKVTDDVVVENEELRKRIVELEPFMPVKWALVEGKPSYDDLADEHAKAVQLVGEQQKRIAELEATLASEQRALASLVKTLGTQETGP